MSKKFVAIVLTLAMLFTLTSCFGKKDDAEEKDDVLITEETISEEDVFVSEKEETKEDKTTPDATKTEKPKPENGELTQADIIDIYLKNKNVWILEEEYIYGQQYFFIDLDFDGVLELVSIFNEGSGLYSRTAFYKIDKNTKNVVEIPTNVEEGEGEFDLASTGKNAPKLLKNKQTGKMLYLATDVLRIMNGEYVLYTGTMSLGGNLVSMDNMFMFYEYSEGHFSHPEGLIEYSVMRNGKYESVSGEQYETEMNKFLSQYNDMNLKLHFIDGETFNSSNETQQKNMLTQGYNGFTYNK